MATVAGTISERRSVKDVLSGTPRAHAVDRWIYVFMAGFFLAIVLAGFIPDSLMKIAMVKAGERPPFPPILHVHAVLMGSFLLLFLTQTVLMATGRGDLHRRLGPVAMVLAPALVVVGFILIPTNYHLLWEASQSADPAKAARAAGAVNVWDNITLLQIQIGVLFSLFLIIALRAREVDAGMHKRMMILAVAMPLPAGIDRIPWLAHSMPASPLSPELYTLLAVSPMFVWDVVRNRHVHRAYWIWLGFVVPTAIAINVVWDAPWWHAFVRRLMGV